jgi:hypothetical protein
VWSNKSNKWKNTDFKVGWDDIRNMNCMKHEFRLQIIGISLKWHFSNRSSTGPLNLKNFKFFQEKKRILVAKNEEER